MEREQERTRTIFEETINIPVGQTFLSGDLMIPEKAKGIILFSHGSGSSRFSNRNKLVANELHKHKFATLVFDLLTVYENRVVNNRFDTDLLTERLIGITNWVSDFYETRELPLGYFGASTGAASALKAAAVFGDRIKAVVSRGGRPDLVLRDLPEVIAPVRLIVGSLDQPVIGMNEVAINALEQSVDKDLVLVPGASHLFEEPGKLMEVASLTVAWFERFI